MNEDERQIREVISTWMEASAAGDTERVLELMTEDVVFLLPGREPMRGRAGFAAASKSMPPGMRIEGRSDIREIQIAGDLAYCWNHLTLDITCLTMAAQRSVREMCSPSSAERPMENGVFIGTQTCSLKYKQSPTLVEKPATLASRASMIIRPATIADQDAIWSIFQTVIASGDTYVFDPGMPREDALAYWFRLDTHTYVAEHEGQVVGTYILKANQPGLGAHVANAGFMVSPAARGLGLGRRMGEHCLAEARRLGFRSMQFNYVVSTNEVAIRLWQQLGFAIVGTVPESYRHAKKGLVATHVMFRHLHDSNPPSPPKPHEPSPSD